MEEKGFKKAVDMAIAEGKPFIVAPAQGNQSTQINELATALAKAQSEIKVASKSAFNPYFESKYADHQEVWDCCRGPLTENGLSVSMYEAPGGVEDVLLLEGLLLHSSGQWLKGQLSVKLQPNKKGAITPQSKLSALTYARRGLLAAMSGVVAGDDDDGNYASGNTAQEPAMSPIQKLARIGGFKQDVVTWWLVDEEAIELDKAGDPGPLSKETLEWILKDREARFIGPCTRWNVWVSILNINKFAKTPKGREALRAYCLESDLFEDKPALKRVDAWSNLRPSVVKHARERWGDFYKSYQDHKKETT